MKQVLNIAYYEVLHIFKDKIILLLIFLVPAGYTLVFGFEKKISLHRAPAVLTVYDASNLIWGYNIRKYTLEVINKFSAEHAASYLAGLGMTGREINNVLDAVSCNVDVWYNPTYSYVTYLFMGLVMMIIHQICLLSVSLTVTREKDRNSWVQYLVLLIWLSARFIHVKAGGSTALIVLLGLLYGTIITSAGFYFSTKAPNSLQVTRYVMLLSVPFFIISGYTWPLTHIPGYVEVLARLLPYTWMAEGMRTVTVKNLGLACISGPILALAAMSAFSVLLAVNFSKRRKPRVAGCSSINSGSYYPQIK